MKDLIKTELKTQIKSGVSVIMSGVQSLTITSQSHLVNAAKFTKEIKITGYKWFNGTKDFYNTGFVATAPNGAKVSGNVSKGVLFKGSTVRLD